MGNDQSQKFGRGAKEMEIKRMEINKMEINGNKRNGTEKGETQKSESKNTGTAGETTGGNLQGTGSIQQVIDGIVYEMKQPFDFDFIHQYGRVFRVFDDQDSGNICFGTEQDGERFFIKFAGALTKRYGKDPAEAVERLKASVPIYCDLKHENLIELVEAKEAGGGFMMVFRWAKGDCMGRMYPEAHARFMALPVGTRLMVFSDVLRFLEHTAAQGYVAIDFYDGSILYDFEGGKTTICDIDFFRKQPCVNDMGRMWGSSLFQSPEEYELGAILDEVTNVYTIGATAFALFGGYQRTRERWELDDRHFAAAARAVSGKRGDRQASIAEFRREWKGLCK